MMTPNELVAAVAYANGIDPRIQTTRPTAELWGRTIGHRTYKETKDAILNYYARPRINDREHPPVDAATLRRIMQDTADQQHASTSARALEAPAHKSPESYRARNPQTWEQLAAQGRQQWLDLMKQSDTK